jgi:hypothetical protein
MKAIKWLTAATDSNSNISATSTFCRNLFATKSGG